MIVNTFSQVYKVFNPKTYVDLKEKFESIHQPPEEYQTKAQKIKYGIINMLKLCALIGDSLAYSVAGGIRSGIHVGETLGETIGAKLALTITMAILSPVILVFVSTAFTWPSVFHRKKSTQYPSQMEKPLIEKMSQSHTPDALQNNTLLPTSEKSPKPNNFKIRQAGLRFFDARLSEECILKPNCSPTLERGTALTSSSL
jgi:hypothetical protein